MTNWGDYAVTAVRYDEDGSRIEKVIRWDVGDKLTNKTERTRNQVISGIEADYDYTTALKTDSGRWSVGEEIHVIKIDGEKFIRTDRNDEQSDNLEDLPEF